MRIFRTLSIKYKLMIVVLLTATIGLTLASGASLFYDRVMQKKSLAENMHILTQVIAMRSAAAMSFGDAQNAMANLESLNVSKPIRLACMYGLDQKVFVKFSRGDISQPCPSEVQGDGEYFENDYLDVFQSIYLNETVIGTVFLRSGLEELDERLQQQLLASGVVLLISLFIAFGLTGRMQRSIYNPIIELGKVAADVTNNNNYAIRAAVESEDEFGKTVRAFNNMLHEIELDKKELIRLAYYDSLTTLPNRRMFVGDIELALGHAAKDGEGKVALMFMDVDRFKAVNDTLGHDIGDILLKEVAKRIQAVLPETATVYRLGGDEFTVIVSGLLSDAGALNLGDSIIEEFNCPLLVAGESLTISISIGIVVSDGNDTAISIMKNADIALYRAKDAGRGNYQLFK